MLPASPKKVALIVEYEGTNYAGFQLQAHAATIQGELEKAIARLTLMESRIHGAGRTDRGVHAQGQVVAFSTTSPIPCPRLVEGLNHFLPNDIAVQAAYSVPMTFDPRRHARSRVYRYTFLNRATPSPLEERYAYRVAGPLDADAMGRGLNALQGQHDFAPLSGAVALGRRTVRHVYATSLWRENDLVRFEVEANAFLPHQMRRIAGLLLAVGTERISQEAVYAMMNGCGDAGLLKNVATLPPHGLCLMKVNYKDFPPHDYQAEDV